MVCYNYPRILCRAMLGIFLGVLCCTASAEKTMVPGHYIYANGTSMANVNSWVDATSSDGIPVFKGVQQAYSWRDMEPSKDHYDFSKINNDILALNNKGRGQKLVIQLTWKSFTAGGYKFPDYIKNNGEGIYGDPAVGGTGDGFYVTNKGSYYPYLWNSNVQNRLFALFQAMRDAGLDSNATLQCINLPETADGQATVNEGVYGNAIKNIFLNLKSKFPNTYVIQYTNFPFGQLSGWADACIDSGVGWGGPDVIPVFPPALSDALVHLTGGQPGVYPYYTNYWDTPSVQGHSIDNNCVKGAAVQPMDYYWSGWYDLPPEKRNFDGNYANATVVMDLNYLFWVYNGTHAAEIRDFVKSKVDAYGSAGGLNTVVPGGGNPPAPTPVPYVWETFLNSVFVRLDTAGANTETVQRSDGTGGTNFVWGGYNAAAAGNISTFLATHRLSFDQGAVAPQSRVYTRFDTETPISSPNTCNVSAVSVDGTGPLAGALLRLYAPTGAVGALKVALLVHTSSTSLSGPGWYQSSSLDYAYPYTTFKFRDLTWRKCDPANAGVSDMEQVDNNGEANIALLPGEAAPNLTVIDGMGLIFADDSGTATACPLENMLIHSTIAEPLAPTAVHALGTLNNVNLTWSASGGATGYNIYRSDASGGPYTLLNAEPVIDTTYDDATAFNDVQYYYVVRAVASVVTSMTKPSTLTTTVLESAPSSEITGMATLAYILTYAADANGLISGTSKQAVVDGGSGTAVTAIPNEGYHFVQWSDNSTDNPRTDTEVHNNISVTAQFAPNNSVEYVWETFYNAAYALFDNTGPNNETIQRSDGVNGTQFAWGGYNAAAAGLIATYLATNRLNFEQSAVPKSRIYTRFDTNTPINGICNNSAISFDGSDKRAGALLRLYQPSNTVGQLKIALLLHTSSAYGSGPGWYQSNSIDYAYPYSTFKFRNLTWRQCDPNNAAVIDMEQVNNGGEGPIVLLADNAEPDLTAIDGMGLIFADESGTASCPLENMLLHPTIVEPLPPTNVQTAVGNNKITLNWSAVEGGVTGYNIYRANVSGGPYSKLNGALITNTTYDDTTAVPGNSCYYVVTAQANCVTGMTKPSTLTTTAKESAYSQEAFGQIAQSSAEHWQRF